MGGMARLGARRRYLLAFCAVLAAGAAQGSPSQAQAQDQSTAGGVDTSTLPRLPSAKLLFASPFTTMFVSPEPIGPTGDALEKALAALGWQAYGAPNTAAADNPTMRTISLKKGAQAINVFITVAPAQDNAISVQYSARPLKVDLPFTVDATAIEYSPDTPSLSLTSREPVEQLLDFYRRELAARGWLLWSEKTNGRQAEGGPTGTLRDGGGNAYFVSDGDPKATLALALTTTVAGTVKVAITREPIGLLAHVRQVYLSRDNVAPLVAVADLPRLPGGRDTGKSTAERASYAVAGNVPATRAALTALLGAQGWKEYAVPLEPARSTGLAFIKGQQGLSVHFTVSPGRNEQSTDQTTIEYVPARLQFALPVPDDAADLIFDEHRPYLSLTAGGTPQAVRAFYADALAASDWAPLAEADIAAKWPNGKRDPQPANGEVAYFIRGDSRPIVVVVQAGADGRTQVELKTPAFAELQTVEADSDIFGLPVPKPHRSAGGTDGKAGREIHAQVTASLDAVLSFYRGALSARGWKEDGPAGAVGADEATLNFTFPEGTATLRLARQYGLTTVSLNETITRLQTGSAIGGGSVDELMQQAQQMMRAARALSPAAPPPAAPRAAGVPAGPLQPLAGGEAPIPVPDTAQDVEFDGEEGTLAFTSASSVTALADFFRSTLRPQGWRAKPSVINNANMAQLDFAKAGKSLSITIMKMGPSSNVTARGSGLEVAGAAAGAPTPDAPAQAAAASPPSAEDLVVEETGGLPVPRRHTMSEATKTPFRRELNATVPLDLAVVLDFYRRELGTRGWTEEAKGAVVAPDRATIVFTSPEGPAVLKLSRKGKDTIISLSVKNPDAAKTAGVLPPAGKARVMFGNILPRAASLVFNRKTIKVPANAGAKAPDGPALDLAPGRYTYSIRTGGKVETDVVELNADETWGLMIGPGGVLALQAY